MALRVIATGHGPHARLVLDGDLDQCSARVLRLRAQSLLAAGHRHLTVDLADASVTGDGVEVLHYVQRIFELAGGTVAVAGGDLHVELALAPELAVPTWVLPAARRAG